MKTQRPMVAITMGDPAGIGPEIISRAITDPRVIARCHLLVYGNADRLLAGAAATGTRLTVNQIASPCDYCQDPHVIHIVDPATDTIGNLTWGHPSPASASAMIAYVNTAVDDAMAGRIDAIATGPINKATLRLANLDIPGHTELLARRTHTRDYAMMLAGDRLKVVLTTIHIPIDQISRTLQTPTIKTVIQLTDDALRYRFGLPQPRIAVAGLNPHAGEGGLFGNEEAGIITPAIEWAVSQGIDASGPYPPDTIFFTASQGAFDAVVAMYHDQGLGPFKMIHFSNGVNTTLGLPIVRTSVDHGTAYDIAGTGQASAQSLTAAILMAARQARWSARASANPIAT